MLQNTLLITLLFLSTYSDLKFNKIPNKYTITASLLGLVTMTVLSGLDGLVSSFLGFLVGLLIFIVPFAFGAMGAGDVKLMAAIGAIKGGWFVLFTFFYAAMVGGLIALIYTITKRGLKGSFLLLASYILKPIVKLLYQMTHITRFLKIYGYFSNLESSHEKLYLPFAVPITIGAVLTLLDYAPGFLIR